MKVATHDGLFHADDVFGVATLKLLFENIEIIRTRDPELLKTADIRLDVGGKNNPNTGDFDHHQTEGGGERTNGIPYASAGLIWKKYGEKLCGSTEVARYVEDRLIQIIDAGDNGVQEYIPKEGILPYTISDIISAYNPLWDENKDFDESFKEAVKLAIKILQREIKKGSGKKKAKSMVRKALEKSEKEYLVLEQYVPWQEVVIEESETLFVIYPATTQGWHLRAVPKRRGSFEVRKKLPPEWAGKTGKELQDLTGVEDASFCHRHLFLAGAETKKGVMKLLALALKQ